MKRLLRIPFLFLVSFCVAYTFAPTTCVSQSLENPNAIVAPKSDTRPSDLLAFGQIDLDQVDVNAIINSLANISPELDSATVRVGAGGMVQTLRDAGVAKIQLGVIARALTRGGLCVVVPCNKVEIVASIVSPALNDNGPLSGYRLIKRKDAVVICPQTVVGMFEGDQPLPQFLPGPESHAKLAALGDFPHFLVLEIPTALKKDLIAIWPDSMGDHLPIPVSPKRLAASIETIVLGLQLPPHNRVEMICFCHDPSGVAYVHEQFQSAVNLIPENLPRPTASVEGSSLKIVFGENDFQSLFTTLAGKAQANNSKAMAMNNLKQLALAFHNFADVYGVFPGRMTVDAAGKPLLSWRVSLLPYLGYQPLYSKFKLDEPWDSDNNRPLIAEMPEVFTIPGDNLAPGLTRIHLPVIEGGAWHGDGPQLGFRDITDGTSITLWAIIAPPNTAAEWTKPQDWKLDEANLQKSVFGEASSTIVGLLDGSVRVISSATNPEVLKQLLTIAGGEVVDYDAIK